MTLTGENRTTSR